MTWLHSGACGGHQGDGDFVSVSYASKMLAKLTRYLLDYCNQSLGDFSVFITLIQLTSRLRFGMVVLIVATRSLSHIKENPFKQLLPMK